MDTLLPSRPEPYKKLLKRSLLLYKASFSAVILFALLTALTIFTPQLFANLLGHDIFLNESLYSPVRLVLMLASNIITLLFFIALLWNMHCVIKKKHEPLTEDLKVGIKKVFYVFAGVIIQNVIISAVAAAIIASCVVLHREGIFPGTHLLSVLIMACVFIGQFLLLLYLGTLFCFFTPLIAIENRSIFGAIEHSIALVWSNWWRTISLQLTPWGCYLILLIIITLITNIDVHLYTNSYFYYSYTAILLSLIIFTFFIPWVAALLLVQLNDLELRRKASGRLLKHEKRAHT